MRSLHSKIEIFCGTGGVGKTTLATSRTLFLASQKKKVLLITIDPAKRLTQLLSMNEKNDGTVQTRTIDDATFDAEIFSPLKTIKRIAKKNHSTVDFSNPILQSLIKPHGGLEELIALLELYYQLEYGKYDVIVLDTPPGKHFIDFLDATKRIHIFFGNKTIELLVKGLKKSSSFSFIGSLLDQGIKKILGALENVTGGPFLENLYEALNTIIKNKETFLEALSLEEDLRNKEVTTIYLVINIVHAKEEESQHLLQKTLHFTSKEQITLLANRSLKESILTWKPLDSEGKNLKKFFIAQETTTLETLQSSFSKIKIFKDIDASDPLLHLRELKKEWQ